MPGYRTDLAIEESEIYKEKNKDISEIDGVISSTEKINECLVTTVNITNKNGEKILGKKMGSYITIEFKNTACDSENLISDIICNVLKKLTGNTENKKILVCGLGNREIICDSIGPLVCEKILVTRHLIENDKSEMINFFSSVSAVVPGVFGVTGIESMEIITGICEKIKPDIVMAIDALAARRIHRLCGSIQITDTGIAPGSGVGNKRAELSLETLNIPTIAIGVPTVIDVNTLACDLITDKEKEKYINNYNMIVTPKDIDVLCKKLSGYISKGINYALQQKLIKEDIDALQNE